MATTKKQECPVGVCAYVCNALSKSLSSLQLGESHKELSQILTKKLHII